MTPGELQKREDTIRRADLLIEQARRFMALDAGAIGLIVAFVPNPPDFLYGGTAVSAALLLFVAAIWRELSVLADLTKVKFLLLSENRYDGDAFERAGRYGAQGLRLLRSGMVLIILVTIVSIGPGGLKEPSTISPPAETKEAVASPERE